MSKIPPMIITCYNEVVRAIVKLLENVKNTADDLCVVYNEVARAILKLCVQVVCKYKNTPDDLCVL